jgi:hypothetical protein
MRFSIFGAPQHRDRKERLLLVSALKALLLQFAHEA